MYDYDNICMLVYRYTRERLIPPKWNNSIEEFKHRSYAKSICDHVLTLLRQNQINNFDFYITKLIEKLDNWACQSTFAEANFLFATQRDVLIDMRDYVTSHLEYSYAVLWDNYSERRTK